MPVHIRIVTDIDTSSRHVYDVRARRLIGRDGRYARHVSVSVSYKCFTFSLYSLVSYVCMSSVMRVCVQFKRLDIVFFFTLCVDVDGPQPKRLIY